MVVLPKPPENFGRVHSLVVAVGVVAVAVVVVGVAEVVEGELRRAIEVAAKHEIIVVDVL